MIVPRRPIIDLALLCAGFTVWASAFVTLYGSLSLGCEWGWNDRALGPTSLQRAVLVAVWFGHLLPALVLALWTRRRAHCLVDREDPTGFLARVSYWANGAGLGAMVLNFLPILTLSTCL